MTRGHQTAPSLKVTYRRGKPLAAYLTLPTHGDRRAHSSRPFKDSIIADLDVEGRCIGLELLDPAAVSLREVNDIVKSFGGDEIDADELRPLQASRSVA